MLNVCFLYHSSIRMYLRKKICILVTHQIQFLQDATKIIVLNQSMFVLDRFCC